MDNASWIYAIFVGVVVTILSVFGLVTFLDDLRWKFLWTREPGRWTKAPLALCSTGFWATGRCKTTISASAQAFVAFRDRFFGRKSKSALTYELELRRWGERFVPRAAIGPIQLKPTQQRAVATLTADPASELTRGQYEQLAGVSRSQAAYDLAELVEAGILDRIGNGRATRYRLAREGGSQRHWTNERIYAELEAFCTDRENWPSAGEFKAAGRGDLYVAASRYGGIGHWMAVLGFERPSRGASTETPRSPLRARLAWAGGGALAALAVAVAAGAVVVALTRHGASPTRPLAQAQGEIASRTTDESMHAAIAGPTPHRVRHTVRQRSHRTAQSKKLVSRSLPSHSAASQPTSTPVVTRNRSFASVKSAPANWPAPLPAPPGGSAPPPLKGP